MIGTEIPYPERKATYHRIADSLREEIMGGRHTPGARLPSTGDLATHWKASPYTVHTALTRLVREGWLERLNGTGTYVIDPGKRFVRAGIYHAVDICANEHPAFVRNIHSALLEQFKELGKETQIFIDTRPLEQQVQLLPTLEKALQERSIQCLVAPSLSRFCHEPFSKIKIPTAYLNNPHSSHKIASNMSDFIGKSVRHLATQGCRSVGLLSTLQPSMEGADDLYENFTRAANAAGLATCLEWIRRPEHYLQDTQLESYGYAEFFRLWNLDEKPDGLIVYPDVVVRGIITAVLEAGIAVVPPRMRFVFHRNAHIAQLCPFPVAWAVSDENVWAAGLIRIIEQQFAGEKVTPLFLPYSLEENVPPAR